MPEIRPPARPFPAAAPAPARPDPARSVEGAPRSAAQKAFFQAALNRPQGAVETSEPNPAPATPMRVEPARAPDTSGASQRYLRPGSLLDIKV